MRRRWGFITASMFVLLFIAAPVCAGATQSGTSTGIVVFPKTLVDGTGSQTPTDTPTGTPTDTPTESPSATPTDTVQAPTDTPVEVGTATSTPSEAPTATFTDTPVLSPTDTPTGTPVGTTTATITATATATGTATGAATATITPTGTPTGTVSATLTATRTATNTPVVPINTPTSTDTPSTTTPTDTPGTATPTVTGGATSTVTNTGGATVTATATPISTATPTVTETSLPIDATIIIGGASGEPGSTVTIEISLESTVPVAGTQNDITFDPQAPIAATGAGKPNCMVNPDIDKGGTSFAFQPAGCTPGTDCTAVRALVLALDNVCPICGASTTDCPGVAPCPVVLYTCQVAIASDATGSIPLPCTNAGAGDPDGNPVGTDCNNGTINVVVPAAATIVIGNAVGAQFDFVPFDVSLQTGVEVAGTQNDITFPPQAPIAAGSNGKPMCAVNPEIDKGGTSFAFQPAGCTVGTDCTAVRALVLALDNVDPIPNGAVLYTCTVAIAEDAADGTYPLTCSNAGASDPDGGALVTNCVDGSVVVGVQPTPTNTVTPSSTPGSATPTSTPGTPPPPTSTLTPPGTNTPIRNPTRFHFADSDSCQIVAVSASRPAWMLLVPAALLLGIRRRRR